MAGLLLRGGEVERQDRSIVKRRLACGPRCSSLTLWAEEVIANRDMEGIRVG
jgi:hypothetical protein